MLKLLKRFFGSNAVSPSNLSESSAPALLTKIVQAPQKRGSGYSAEVLQKHGFKLPPSNVDKNFLGKEFEKSGEFEKAIACYEGCIQNNFDGTFPYDRLAVIYRKLGRSEDEIRVLKRAFTVYSEGAASGQGRSNEKAQRYADRLQKLTDS